MPSMNVSMVLRVNGRLLRTCFHLIPTWTCVREFGSPRYLADYLRVLGASGAVSDYLEGGEPLNGLVPLQRMQIGSTPGRQAWPERSRFGPVA